MLLVEFLSKVSTFSLSAREQTHTLYLSLPLSLHLSLFSLSHLISVAGIHWLSTYVFAVVFTPTSGSDPMPTSLILCTPVSHCCHSPHTTPCLSHCRKEECRPGKTGEMSTMVDSLEHRVSTSLTFHLGESLWQPRERERECVWERERGWISLQESVADLLCQWSGDSGVQPALCRRLGALGTGGHWPGRGSSERWGGDSCGRHGSQSLLHL